MTIQIKSIQINKLGPLESLNLDLGMLNLIYGHNETGKTFLVEFLLQSIFSHSKNWNLRDTPCEGSVLIQGIHPETISFSPISKRKIEDYWKEADIGLPHNMARLLVVKGGELALSADTPGGVNRAVLKTALTSQALIDQILGTIPVTVQKASLENLKIKGKNQGQIKEHNQFFSELQNIKRLLDQIETKYSQGPARQIELQCAEIEESLTEQQRAKRYLAFYLGEKQKEIKAKGKALDDGSLDNLRDHIRDHSTLNNEVDSLNRTISESQEMSNQYTWLESAIDVWEDNSLDDKGEPSWIIGLAGMAILASGFITIVTQYFLSSLDLFWPGVAITILGFGLSLFYGIKLLRWTTMVDDANERKTVQTDFKGKFGSSASGLTDLKAQKNKLQEIHLSRKRDQENIINKNLQLDKEKMTIENFFLEITGDRVNEKEWDKRLQKLKKQSADLDQQANELAIQQSRLNIDEDKYLSTPAANDYVPETVNSLEESLQILKEELSTYREELETLKARACERTGDEISTPWPNVFYHLNNLCSEIEKSYKALSAELIAKIGLTEILSKLQAEEDQKIRRDINAPEVADLLQNLTGKYRQLDLINDQLYVHDQYRQYALSDLSTGAREQVQLALRLGIASRVSGGNPLFLILDDAFQHSDWNRRESLVQGAIDLVQSGWQILYLSMDDHIRDLFLKKAKPALKRKFKYFTLD